MRTGPGTQYPISWVYIRRNMPIEIIAEFGNWRKVRDIDNEQGWILHNLLSGKRTAIIQRQVTAYSLDGGNRAVLRLTRGVQVLVNECKKSACEIVFDETRGWVDKSSLWGVYNNEIFD